MHVTIHGNSDDKQTGLLRAFAAYSLSWPDLPRSTVGKVLKTAIEERLKH